MSEAKLRTLVVVIVSLIILIPLAGAITPALFQQDASYLDWRITLVGLEIIVAGLAFSYFVKVDASVSSPK
jgi:hypothetical protein